MESLFAQSEPQVPLVGIARLAAQGEAISEGHKVDYIALENRSLLAAEWTETQTGREAKFYRLTQKGKAQLEEETASWRRLTGAVGLILRMTAGGAE